MKRSTASATEPNPTLVPLPVSAVDLIRFEKNLLQIGFFGAHDTRHNNLSTRRIEQWVNRNGQKIKVAAEFRGSAALGLPSTSDRDKYIAFMKIAMDHRWKMGRVENPVRFTGYQMLKELGLTYSGENYEDINRWGQRMADTTITSEQVIYLAARKKYANKTVHVFRSFVRAGQSNLDDSGRAEHYEVVLEDWLLENLNQSYVIPEDFNSYRRLKRATAKGIFGYLHLWFHASQGRPVEKDYSELCMLLNIPVYRHVSKIKETMGRSLDELSEVGYLSSWDIRRMVTKEGFKLVLLPGEELLHVLAISQRKSLKEAAEGSAAAELEFDDEQNSAMQALLAHGVLENKARSLVSRQEADALLDQIEYAEHLMSRGKRGRMENPAGFIIYAIESRLPVPANFPSSRKIRKQQEQLQAAAKDQEHRIRLEDSYQEFLDRAVDEEIRKQYPGAQFAKRLRTLIADRVKHDERFAQIVNQEPIAEHMLREEIRESLALPGFEDWCKSTGQMSLFQ
jgi:Replication initiator protein A